MLKHMVLLQEKCIKCKIFKSFTRFNDFKDENKMLVVKLKKQHFKFIKLKRRISSFITALASATGEKDTPGRRGAKPPDSIEQGAKPPVR